MNITKTQFSNTKPLDTFGNHIAYDNVTEYKLILDNSLTVNEFENILKDQGINLYGFVSFTKKMLTYFDIETMTKKIKYMHIAREVMA